ncbi:hypothetical protein LCI18_015035 [Fusarium solani-melongenae]|uniref:Uncharacterized protein n=1 Tax=Fusarium solani subsp. cucurbitae TaxID=2747967 RepID=A0ACD3ZS88_FUSSC|nr:hypothetical protein LCI18_015035 [Fusarium solani-melongenae]
MTASLELFVLPWGVYPRRVLLYLSEKGILSSPLIKITPVTITRQGMSTPDGKPPGTVPMLKLPDGTFIKESVAILEYFEDICADPQSDWQKELAKSAVKSSMRGETPEQRARIRDMLFLSGEACNYFGFACHKGTALFALSEATNAHAAKLSLEYCKKTLTHLSEYYEGDNLEDDRQVTIADCVLYSMLHFAKDLYGLHLVDDLPNLQRFYGAFGKRESAQVKEDHFPQEVKELACQWLPVE